jgi:hypothetical protein
MTPETKKTLLIAGAGVAGIAIIWYLMKTSGGNAAVSSAGLQPLQVPTPGAITFNYPPLENPTPVGPAATPSTGCTEICTTCDDNTSYAGTAAYRIPANVLAAQSENLGSIGEQVGKSHFYNSAGVWSTYSGEETPLQQWQAQANGQPAGY